MVVVITADGSVDASSGGIARVSSASVVVITCNVGVSASVSIGSNGANIGGASISVIAVVGADAVLSASTVSQACSSAWVSGNVNTSGSDESIENGGESREISSVEGSLNSGQISSNDLDLVSINTADSNGKEDDSLVLGGVQRNLVISDVVFSIGKDQEDSRDWSVGSRDGSSISRNIVE